MDDKAYSYFQSGFQKCKEKFDEISLLLADIENFPNLDKSIDSLLDEDADGSGKYATDAVRPEYTENLEPCIVLYKLMKMSFLQYVFPSLLLVI